MDQTPYCKEDGGRHGSTGTAQRGQGVDVDRVGEWERKGRQGAAVPARDPATVAMEKMDNNVIIVDVLPVRQQPKSVEEERMLQEKYGNMKDLEE